MLGYFNKCNIIKFTNKTTLPEDFDDVHYVSLYDISENMESLAPTVKYGDINASDHKTMGYYILK